MVPSGETGWVSGGEPSRWRTERAWHTAGPRGMPPAQGRRAQVLSRWKLPTLSYEIQVTPRAMGHCGHPGA